jgi:hypothetical protein
MISKTKEFSEKPSRRGITAIGDFTFIIVFCVVAFIIFFVLFKPMIDELEDKPLQRIEMGVLPVYSDAQYVALGLRERRAVAGSSGQTGTTFASIVQSIGQARVEMNKDSAFEEYLEGSGYDETLESVFGKGSLFWSGGEYYLVDETRVRQRKRVMVILRQEGLWIKQTCREFTAEKGLVTGILSTNSCNRFDGDGKDIYLGKVIDPDTQIEIPDWFGSQKSETGIVYIPSASGPVTVYLFIMKEEKEK